METRKHSTSTQLSSTYHGNAQVGQMKIFVTIEIICDFPRSLASRGELLPIYNKAKEKSLELDKMKKEKKAAAKV